MYSIQKLSQKLMSLYQPQCALCEQEISTMNKVEKSFFPQHWVCDICYSTLPFHSLGCVQCAAPIFPAPIHHSSIEPYCSAPITKQRLCGQCLQSSSPIDKLIATFDYKYPIKHWLAQYKFHNKYAFANWFGLHMAHSVLEQASVHSTSMKHQLFHGHNIPFCEQNLPDAIVPMPLHPRRLKERGYNQSLLIAQYLSRRFQIPLIVDGITRTKHTSAQSALTLKQRQHNVQHAFKISRRVPKSVAIVDDVFTTGATIYQLSNELKHNGAKQVTGWVIAYAPLK